MYHPITCKPFRREGWTPGRGSPHHSIEAPPALTEYGHSLVWSYDLGSLFGCSGSPGLVRQVGPILTIADIDVLIHIPHPTLGSEAQVEAGIGGNFYNLPRAWSVTRRTATTTGDGVCTHSSPL